MNKGQWLVYTCFCTIETLVCLGLPQAFWNESFEEEVVQFVELSCPLGCKNVYSPMQGAPCHALEGRNDALRERELEGKPALQLKCWGISWLHCGGRQSLAYLCCLLPGPGWTFLLVSSFWCREVEEAWLSSHAQVELETFCSEVKLRQMHVTGELGSEG